MKTKKIEAKANTAHYICIRNKDNPEKVALLIALDDNYELFKEIARKGMEKYGNKDSGGIIW